METTTYTVDGRTYTVRRASTQLQHHGVKGMKWGRRKARPVSVGGSRHAGRTADSPEAQAARKEARRKKAKRALKIGTAVVAAGLAAYGAKKLHDVVRDKNYKFRMEQGRKVIDAYIKKTSDAHYNTDWRVRRQHEDRDRKYMERVFSSASRQADKDSFATAVENVIYDYLDKRQRR